MARRQSPLQKRGERTVGAILEATAELLSEVGFQGLSTNLICQRMGMTPPALYRYFPNKFAILRELGERLMKQQNDRLASTPIDTQCLEISFRTMLRGQYEVTRQVTSGGWIMRSLYAVPLLCDVRLESHDDATDALAQNLCELYPGSDAADVRRKTRLCIEIGNSVLEYLFEHDDLDVELTIEDTAKILHSYLLPALKDAA